MELQEQHNNELKCQVSKLSTDLTNRDAELSRVRDELGQQIKLNRQLEEQRSQITQVKKQNGKLQEELDRVVKKVRPVLLYIITPVYHVYSINNWRRLLNSTRTIKKNYK